MLQVPKAEASPIQTFLEQDGDGDKDDKVQSCGAEVSNAGEDSDEGSSHSPTMPKMKVKMRSR